LRRSRLVVLACGAALLASASIAAAATSTTPPRPTRAEYVASAEKICAANKRRTNKLVIAANQMTEQGDTKTAGAKVVKAAAVFGKGVEAVGGLKRPKSDRAVLRHWLQSEQVDVELFRKLGKTLATGKADKVTKVSAAVTQHGKQSNAIVAGFGFHSCLITR
jgi:hypothetical protein